MFLVEICSSLLLCLFVYVIVIKLNKGYVILYLAKNMNPFFFYLDDVVITYSAFCKHLCLLSELKQAILTVNLVKCKLFQTSLKYLGFFIGGIPADLDNVPLSSDKV